MTTFDKTAGGIGRYTLSDGSTRWRVVFKFDGKTRSKCGFRTKGEAQHWQRHTLVSIDKGEHITPEKRRLTFGTFAEDWLGTANLRPSTRTVYGYMLRGDLASWHDVPLSKVTPASVRKWRYALENRAAANGSGTLSAASVQKAYRLLKRILGVAVEDGHLLANPCRESFKEEAKELHCPTAGEVRAIAGSIDSRYRAMVLLAGFGGLRWGEVIALRRSAIDVTSGCLHVREQAVEMADGRLLVSDLLKSEAGRRTVYLPRFVVDALAVHLTAHAEPGPDGLLFPAERPVGHRSQDPERPRYLRRSNFRRRVWLPALAAAGVPHLRFHDLRHGAATMAAQAGATTAELMAHIGHSTPRASMRYQHATDERMRSLAGRLDELVGEGATSNVVPLRRADG